MDITHQLLVLLLVCVYVETVTCIQCLDQSGSPVDWFVVYKLPKIDESISKTVQQGTGFYYMDIKSPKLELSKNGMSDKDHAVYNTLDQIYHNKTDIAYIMYNDQQSSKSNSEHGHTKGVVAVDKLGGFWMVHSTPKFPSEKSSGYSWPENGIWNGQTFLCISTVNGVLDDIGTVFNYTFPHIYETAFPSTFTKDYPRLASIVESRESKHQNHVTSPPWDTVVKLITKGKNTFFSYSKYTMFGKDLYDGLLSGQLKQDIFVQSWRTAQRNPGDNLPSNCSIPYKVYNIENIKFSGDISFNTTKDHSKWAVSKNGGNWLCIGDINRQKPQFHRGGGQVCFQNTKASNSFRNLIKEYEKC